MINLLLVLHAALLLTFDILPQALRLAAAGALALGYGALALRQMAAYPAFLALLLLHREISLRVLLGIALAITVASALHALLWPQVMLNGTPRLAPFSSGLHSTQYAMVAALLVVQRALTAGLIGAVAAAAWAGALLLLMLGNGVRTPLVFLLTYAAAMTALRLGPRPGPLLLALGYGLLTAVLAGLVLIALGFEQADALASGRLANYAQRLSLLGERSLAALLVGTGPGTDLLRTDIWWWDEKDSHSDLLRLLWEGGIVGLLAVLAFWGLVLLREGRALLPLVLALLVSSAISNAFLTRPNAAFLLFAVAVMGPAPGRRVGARGLPA